MRVLPTSRRVGRLNPQPQAKDAVARLLARQWWFGTAGTDGADVEAAPAIPAGTRWGVVRLVGPGGQAITLPEDSSTAWLGAGGCYARRLLPMRAGQVLNLVIGGPGFTSSPAPPSETSLTLDGVVVCRAAGGPHATLGAHASAPLAADCIGDVIRPGGPGGATAYHGGAAGGDLHEADSLSLGGMRRQPRNIPVPAPFDTQRVVADYGAGGVAGANGDPGFLWWPPSPSGANYQVGGPGRAVLEFYDRRPY
jgi:hypothetical protein